MPFVFLHENNTSGTFVLRFGRLLL